MTHSKMTVALSAGTLLVLCVVVSMFCIAAVVGTVLVHQNYIAQNVVEKSPIPNRFPTVPSAGSNGNIGASKSIEDAYGPLNSEALNETKEGILANFINRRRSRVCGANQWNQYQQPALQQSQCLPQQQAWYSVQYPSYSPSYPINLSGQSCGPGGCLPAQSQPMIPVPTPSPRPTPEVDNSGGSIVPKQPSLPFLPDIQSFEKGVVPSL